VLPNQTHQTHNHADRHQVDQQLPPPVANPSVSPAIMAGADVPPDAAIP
jgi:hypothetical protein